MSTRSKIETLPDDIKDALIEKAFSNEGYQSMSDFLNNNHNIKAGRSVIWRFCKATRDKYGVLAALGMPIKEIINNRPLIDALGVEQVKQQLLAKLAEKIPSLFTYLDDKAGNQ